VRLELDDGPCTYFALAGRQWHAGISLISRMAGEMRREFLIAGAAFNQPDATLEKSSQ
jgi:hypothetical protein